MRNARLILVEDNAFTLATLGDALALQGFDVKARVATATEALNAQSVFNPHVAILDLDLGIGPTGIDIAIALRERNPDIGIVFLTTYKDPRLIEPNLPELPEGAIYLNKLEMNSTQLIANHISAAVLKPKVRRAQPWNRKGALASLSSLQIEILREVVSGLSTSEIAKNRGVSEQAVDKTISRISHHLGIEKTSDMNQRVQIVRAYFEQRGQGL
jgi:DNA-binding NarL/FixJ family response regulator